MSKLEGPAITQAEEEAARNRQGIIDAIEKYMEKFEECCSAVLKIENADGRQMVLKFAPILEQCEDDLTETLSESDDEDEEGAALPVQVLK